MKQANLHSEIDSEQTTGNSSSHITSIRLGLTERRTCIKIDNHTNVPFIRYELIQIHLQTYHQKSAATTHVALRPLSVCLTNDAADEYISLSTAVLVINV